MSLSKKEKGYIQTHFEKEGDIPGEFLIEFMLTTLLKNHYLQGTMEMEHYKIAVYQDPKSKLV